jgi:hypothetical protein
LTRIKNDRASTVHALPIVTRIAHAVSYNSSCKIGDRDVVEATLHVYVMATSMHHKIIMHVHVNVNHELIVHVHVTASITMHNALINVHANVNDRIIHIHVCIRINPTMYQECNV